MSRTNETKYIKWHKNCKCKCRLDASVIINKIGMRINSDVNAKNWLTKKDVIKDLFGILANENVNMIYPVMLENI